MTFDHSSHSSSMESVEQYEIPEDAIAVVGMSGRFPGAPSLQAFEDLLWNGREGIMRFSPEEADCRPMGEAINTHENFVPAAAALDGIEMFDAAAFGLSAREAVLLDPQHRLFLECAAESLDDAAITPQTFDGRIGVFGGCGISSYLLHELVPDALLRQADPLEVMMGCDKDFIATRVSYLLNLTGPSMTVQTACSTSLLAVHVAAQSILSGECDAALAGGATITTPQKLGYIYHPGGIRSIDGHCRPFDAKGSGTVFGSGVGVVLLRRLDAALRDGDPIRAVLRASAVNNDGNEKIGFTAPGVSGQADVLAEALALSGLEAKDIGYVEGHGTATPMGDPIEFTALSEVYDSHDEQLPSCVLGSVKSNVGHLDAAAGIAGFIKTVLTLERGTIPPTLHFTAPNSEIDLPNSRFRISKDVEPWPVSGVRRACVSSFGVGGTNVHTVLEQAPPHAFPEHTTTMSEEPILLPVSARSQAATTATVDRLAECVQEDTATLCNMAHTLQTGRQQASFRRAVTVQSGSACSSLKTAGPVRKSRTNPKACFLFAGQGSQYPGMSRALAERFAPFRKTLEQCIEGFHSAANIDLAPLLLEAGNDDQKAAENLRQTSLAQPAIFTHTMACAQLWIETGVKPSILLGHSIGEWSSAVLAGIVSLEDAISLVARRAEIMQAAPQGAMLSIPLSEADSRQFLNEGVDLAVINGKELCVLSGPKEALEPVANTVENAKWLRTSHGFHSRYMDDAARSFSEAVAKVHLSPPVLPVVSNLTGETVTPVQATDPAYWGALLKQPVQFHKGLHSALNIADFSVECGPGNGLTGLAALAAAERDITDFATAATSPSAKAGKQQSPQQTRAFFVQSAGIAWEAGAAIDFSALAPVTSEPPRRMRLPATCFERKAHWPNSPAKNALPFAASADKTSANQMDTQHQAPQSVLERLLAVWAEVLALETVAPDQGFLELGGTSVIAMQLVARCRQEGLVCKATDVMRLQTPQAIAEHIEKTQPKPSLNKKATRTVTLADTVALSVLEGSDSLVHLQATVHTSEENARECAIPILEHAHILRTGWRKSWMGIHPVSPEQSGNKPTVYDTPPALAPDHGLSGALSVAPSGDGSACTLTVSLHTAAGSPGEAATILKNWAKACREEQPSLTELEQLGNHKHAPLRNVGQMSPRRCGQLTTAYISSSQQEKISSVWNPATENERARLFCALAAIAGGRLEETRIYMDQIHLVGLPSFSAENNIDEILLGLRLAGDSRCEPIGANFGTVRVDWLGDLKGFSHKEADEMLMASASARVDNTSGTIAIAVGTHADNVLFQLASTIEEIPASAISSRLRDALDKAAGQKPLPAFLIAPQNMTASSAPFQDLKILFELETSDAV